MWKKKKRRKKEEEEKIFENQKFDDIEEKKGIHILSKCQKMSKCQITKGGGFKKKKYLFLPFQNMIHPHLMDL